MCLIDTPSFSNNPLFAWIFRIIVAFLQAKRHNVMMTRRYPIGIQTFVLHEQTMHIVIRLNSSREGREYNKFTVKSYDFSEKVAFNSERDRRLDFGFVGSAVWSTASNVTGRHRWRCATTTER